MGFFFVNNKPSKAKDTPPATPKPKGILRRPSAHFITYDDRGNPSTDDGTGKMRSLPTDVLPSTRASRYPTRRAREGRNSEQRTSFVPPGWKPGMAEPKIEGRVNYVTVNTAVTPNRYCRDRSQTPFPHPGLKCVMIMLKSTLKKDSKQFSDYLSDQGVLTGSWWDNEHREGSKSLVQQAKRDPKTQREHYFFGGRIKDMHEKGSMPVSAHGFQFRVPIVLQACVEELYRRGMRTPGLFGERPNRQRILELVKEYDELPDNAPLPDLSRESIHTVGHLLGFWINALPAPLMHRTFFDAFSAWCVEPSLAREKEFKHIFHTKPRTGPVGEDAPNTEAEGESEEEAASSNHPPFSSREKRLRRKQRVVERAQRANSATGHPNGPSDTLRRIQMYGELYRVETPNVNHSRLLCMLIAPHSFAVMIYLFTYLASLMDYPETKATAKVLAEKFAWKLLGGPNKEVSRGLMEWLLTRWDRIAHGFKSEHALAWEKRRDGEKTGERSHSSQTHVSEPAPQYEKKERRGSGESVRSDAPSYHSTSSNTQQESDERRASGSSSSSEHRSHRTSAPPPSAPCLTVPAVAPRLHDFNPGKPLCGPQPSPASVELANPWEAEDTPVITPFRAEDGVYEAAMEDRHHDVGVEDVWDEFQRAEFEAIESMLQPSADGKQPPPSVCSEADDMSVYSQDDDLLDEIINDYSDDSQTHLPQSQEQGNHEVAECLIPSIPKHTRHIAVAPDEDDPAMLKQQFEAALLERELVQKKLETLSKKFQGIQLR